MLFEQAFFALLDKNAGDPQALVKQALAAGLPPADAAYARLFDENISQVIDHLKEASSGSLSCADLETLPRGPDAKRETGRTSRINPQSFGTLRHDSLSEIFYQSAMHAVDREMSRAVLAIGAS